MRPLSVPQTPAGNQLISDTTQPAQVEAAEAPLLADFRDPPAAILGLSALLQELAVR